MHKRRREALAAAAALGIAVLIVIAGLLWLRTGLSSRYVTSEKCQFSGGMIIGKEPPYKVCPCPLGQIALGSVEDMNCPCCCCVPVLRAAADAF